MKKVNHKLFFILCLLIACLNTSAQTTEEDHECEVIVTRADIERCALYKRNNQLLEREIKFQAVAAVSQKDSSKMRENKLNTKIAVLVDSLFNKKIELAKVNTDKENREKWLLYSIIAFLLSIIYIFFSSKIKNFFS